MKKIYLLIFFLGAFIFSFSQEEGLQAAYLRFPTIPPFTLLKLDSTNMTREDLTKNKKTLIMYFHPDCDHCRHQTDSLLKNMEKFKDVQILMATNKSFGEMKAFYKEYHLAKYPNIKMGRDTQFFFPPFYKMVNLPFLILYNKNGKLITTFEGPASMEKVASAFR